MFRGIVLNPSVVLSIISLIVSVTVAWLTLFRRGNLYMTRPVQIALLYENQMPKIFLRTLLYATGKRGFVIEGLYLKIRRGAEDRTFGFWGYGERNDLMVAGGLRINEEGVAYNHHFLEINRNNHFHFTRGDYEISVYARIINRSPARLLYKANVTLSEDDATEMYIRTRGMLFTWEPDAKAYRGHLQKPASST